ncbi:mercury methylation ferredoxin HgcB [Geothermobacter hydrogeniphilus]|uniref:Ferredoxin n=1 Tax=Geothermobacter hydrogeniphilus TaxID=1969733 RepID=A0A1X0XN49_9BACT|nr:mercury methylation ferredoxin HgcB [Geothermobacter hydrogeniphilus]ORJ54263.1 ferredoxin [Geothermobacter hydrogeniphilus]
MREYAYLNEYVSLQLDSGKCTGCGLCQQVCPHAVLRVEDGKARIDARERCMECGACAKNCAFDALKVEAGVGCASAIIYGWLTGKEASCDCSGGC